MALAHRPIAFRRLALPLGTPFLAMARRGLGAQSILRRFAEDRTAMGSDFPGATSSPGRVFRARGGRRGPRHYPLSGPQREPADFLREDHQAGGRKALA